MVREGASMVLEIPGKILGQEDVRETPASAGAFSFDTDDFTDTAGLISLKNKTSYYAINPASWTSNQPDVDDKLVQIGEARVDTGNISFSAPVNLPHGAVVTNVIIHGNAGTENETWTLYRVNKDSNTLVVMASAAFNTADSTISSATIDNQNYSYGIFADGMETTDKLHAGIITYTTDYD